MQTKEQKRLVALEKIEKRILGECWKIENYPHLYSHSDRSLSLGNTKLVTYMAQANEIRKTLKMSLLSLSYYDIARGDLVITDGVQSNFYPKED